MFQVVLAIIQSLILIPKSCQIQSAGRDRGTCQRAVAAFQNPGNVLRCQLSFRSVEYGTGDGPYHIIQEAVGADLQFQKVAAAAHIAGALNAKRLIMMTDIAGVLKDKDDPSTLIPDIKVSEAKELYKQGVISGGMIPKVDCCIEAISKGVKKVIIMDGRVPHSILMELFTDEGAGTMVHGD